MVSEFTQKPIFTSTTKPNDFYSFRLFFCSENLQGSSDLATAEDASYKPSHTILNIDH